MQSFEGDRIVTASEMAKIEEVSFKEGASAEFFMQRAGDEIAKYLLTFMEERETSREVLLLVGKGNNGGDAYTAGLFLLQAGVQVAALHLFPLQECSPLCNSKCSAFQAAGGKVDFLHLNENFKIKGHGLILDGLLGTGFRGKVEGLMLRVITETNRSGLPIIAIDIPSGVDGNTGEVSGQAIEANCTIYLGLPKLGFFLREGYNHIGDLVGVDFGLPPQYAVSARAEGILFCPKSLYKLLPPMKRSQHKYRRGYVLAVAGSLGMSGAALMSCLSALRAGAGIVRLFYPAAIADELVAAPWEIIRQPLKGKNLKPIIEEAARAGSLFVGPGIGKGAAVATLLKKLLEVVDLPLVIDADGIDALSRISVKSFPPQCILTPHRGELKKMLGLKTAKEEELLNLAQQYADRYDVTIVYKGAPTWVFYPKSLPIVMPVGDPGMATAGSGDVLTGIIAALLAKGMPTREAAVLAVAIHGMAGKIAAQNYTSYSVIAGDIIEALPKSMAFAIDETIPVFLTFDFLMHFLSDFETALQDILEKVGQEAVSK